MGYIKEVVWCIGTRENKVTKEEAIKHLESLNIVIEIPISKYKIPEEYIKKNEKGNIE